MALSRFNRRVHDPWGNKNGGTRGNLCRLQFLVGKAALQRSIMDHMEAVPCNVSEELWHFDKPHQAERTNARFVMSSKRGIERIRR